VVANCLDHHLATGLAAGVAVGVELMDELVSLSIKLLEVAGQASELLLHLGLVGLARPVQVVSLEFVGQWDS